MLMLLGNRSTSQYSASVSSVEESLVEREQSLENTKKRTKFLPPQGRELLAAVKLGIPGAKEEFDKQQQKFARRLNTRRRFSDFNQNNPWFDYQRGKHFAAKDTLGYYKVMGLEGLEGSATLEEIKAAFRSKAKHLHPDMHKSQSKSKDKAFKFLVKAYNVLKDPQQRAFYDSQCMY